MIAADGVLCDISQRLAARDLTVHCLLKPGQDPHRLQLTPQQSQELRSARLLLINGYGLTPALEDQAGAVAIAERAVPNSPLLNAEPHTEPHTEPGADAHQHNQQDPHVWHDPRQAAALVGELSRQLQTLKPEAAAAIRQRASNLQQGLLALHRWNGQQFASIPGPRVLATGHRGFASLARAYGFQELSLLDGASSSAVLRPQALEQVLNALRRQRVQRLFAEQSPASPALRRISSLSGVPLAAQPLIADGLAPAANNGPGNLMATLTANTCLIVEELGGECDRRAQSALLRQWDRRD